MTEQKRTGRRAASVPARPAAAEAVEVPAAPAQATSATPGPRAARRAAEAAAAAAPATGPDAACYTGRRYSTTMRYAPAALTADTGTRAEPESPATAAVADIIPLLRDAGNGHAPAPAAADAAAFDSAIIGLPEDVLAVPAEPENPQDAAESGQRTADNVIDGRRSFHRPALAWSHRFAAVAAVSGLALAAAYPALTTPDQAEASRVAHTTSASVADVNVPGNDKYSVVRTSVSSSFSKDDQLSYLMSASGGDVTKVDTAGVLAQPVSPVRITSPFGARVNPTGEGSQVHIGQDYGIPCGTPVKAAAAGTVVQAESAGHSGNRVRIDHGNGLETTYNHNTSLKVSVGQHVDRGDVVSLSGTTGNSTGCHLHLEVLVDGHAVDPAGWL